MKILVTAATEMELSPLKILVAKNRSLKKRTDFLVTGIGMTATAYHMAKHNKRKYDLAVNIGVAGSFTKKISIGEVVNVKSDCFADLGAEDGNSFLTLAEIGLQQENQFPFREGRIFNKTVKRNSVLRGLKQVSAITVNTVHGDAESIKKVMQKFNPDIETMEGAAFFYVCMMEKISCVQLRTISNFVERRNRDNWNIPLAIKNLTEVVYDFLNIV